MVYPSPELEQRLKKEVTSQNISLINRKPWMESYRKVDKKSLIVSPYDDIIVLCVDFPDRPAQLPITDIYSRFFSTTDRLGYTFTNYYNEVSYGSYIPTGNVYGWYRLPQNTTYYLGDTNGLGNYPNNYERLVEDALNVLRQDNLDLSIHDKNSDHIFDYLFVVHAGAEASATGLSTDFWAHMYSITPKLVNGYGFQYYAASAEYITTVIDPQVCGVDVHEHGHLLGLPDLYTPTSSGVGMYSLMANGSWSGAGLVPSHLDARSKVKLGFANHIDNVIGINIPLFQSETNNTVIKYTTNDINEYFLLENRQATGFDEFLPSSGLLIWHINERYPDNQNPSCYYTRLIQADGRLDIESAVNSGDAGDAYPGQLINRNFNNMSNPNTQLCDGSFSLLDISNIYNTSGIITYDSINGCITPICGFSMYLG